MRHFFIGIVLGTSIEFISSFVVYNLVAAHSKIYIDSIPFIIYYPLLAGIIISISVGLFRRSILLPVGIISGIALSIFGISLLLYGA